MYYVPIDTMREYGDSNDVIYATEIYIYVYGIFHTRNVANIHPTPSHQLKNGIVCNKSNKQQNKIE